MAGPNPIDLHIGKQIRRRRRILSLSQADLAEKLGIRFQQVQKYESAANRVTAARLYAISQALETRLDYFFQGLPNVPFQEPRRDQA